MKRNLNFLRILQVFIRPKLLITQIITRQASNHNLHPVRIQVIKVKQKLKAPMLLKI